MKKPVLMIHEIYEDLFTIDLEKYILTFDDGLYSQYYYYPKFKEIKTEKIYFISSNIICDGIQSNSFPKCHDAHEKAFNGNKEDYMSLEQIKHLMEDPLVTIGGHSHYHKNLNDFNRFSQKINHIIDDTKLMIHWFEENLKFKPTSFCFPYNDDCKGIYRNLMIRMGFTNLYGNERFFFGNTCDTII